MPASNPLAWRVAALGAALSVRLFERERRVKRSGGQEMEGNAKDDRRHSEE